MNHISIWTFVIACTAALQSSYVSAQALPGQGAADMSVAATTSQPDEEKNTQGLFIAPLGGTGLNADRARGYGAGLRLLPHSGAYVGYQMGNWTIGSAVHQEDEAEQATWLDMSASYGFNPSRQHRISIDGGVSVRTPGDVGLGSVSDPYAFRVGEHAEPGAGFRLSWRYDFGRNHYVSTILGFDHRFGTGLHDGPEAERSATSFGTVYGYRFY